MLDWIYPPRCAACGDFATALCATCQISLDPLGPACPRCAEPTIGERMCRRCVTSPLPLDEIASPWKFGGQLAVAIRLLKYAGRAHIARDVAPLWSGAIAAAASRDADAIVVPIPMHWRRRFARGFDHAWLLALHACRDAELAPPVPALRRIRAATPQSKLTAAARRENLRDAFAVRRDVAGRVVVLVDDVVTTGATLAAAAHTLRAAGATRVVGVALARATSVPG